MQILLEISSLSLASSKSKSITITRTTLYLSILGRLLWSSLQFTIFTIYAKISQQEPTSKACFGRGSLWTSDNMLMLIILKSTDGWREIPLNLEDILKAILCLNMLCRPDLKMYKLWIGFVVQSVSSRILLTSDRKWRRAGEPLWLRLLSSIYIGGRDHQPPHHILVADCWVGPTVVFWKVGDVTAGDPRCLRKFAEHNIRRRCLLATSPYWKIITGHLSVKCPNIRSRDHVSTLVHI